MFSSWLDEHLETFVRPHMGRVPNVNPKNSYVVGWTPGMSIVLKAVWEQAKRRSEGRTILLAGRDVWEFEILARLDRTKTIFRPDISGSVARHVPKMVTDDYSECYLLDTGYAGSVPRGLGVTRFDLLAFNPGQKTPEVNADRKVHQVFPYSLNYILPTKTNYYRYGRIYSLATKLEGNAKYWTQASIFDGKIYQKLNEPVSKGQFDCAAQLTQHIAMAFMPPRATSPPNSFLKDLLAWRFI